MLSTSFRKNFEKKFGTPSSPTKPREKGEHMRELKSQGISQKVNFLMSQAMR